MTCLHDVWRCEWRGDKFYFQEPSGYTTSFSGPIEAVKQALLRVLPEYAKIADNKGYLALASKCRKELAELQVETYD